MRSRTATWFECKVRYDQTQESGLQKAVTEQYVVAIRRQYGDSGGRCHFRDHALRPREDGLSNALSTFDKDNYVLIAYE